MITPRDPGKVNVYLADASTFDVMNEAYASVLTGSETPPRMTIGDVGLPRTATPSAADVGVVDCIEFFSREACNLKFDPRFSVASKPVDAHTRSFYEDSFRTPARPHHAR